MNKGPDSFSNEVHDEMLRSVFLMRRLSVLSSLISTLYLSVFFVTFDISVVEYLSILWAVSSVRYLLILLFVTTFIAVDV